MFGIRIDKTTTSEWVLHSVFLGHRIRTVWAYDCQGNIDLNWYQYQSIKSDEKVVYA